MRLEQFNGEEYAGALKEALRMRREGTITRPVDNQLGLMAYNIAMWAIRNDVKKGLTWPAQAEDPDFRGEIVAGVCSKLDSVSLDKDPPQILLYLYQVARHAIMDFQKRMKRAKRQHEDVDIASVILVSDFYGRPAGTGLGEFQENNA